MKQPDDKLTAFKYWLSHAFKWVRKETNAKLSSDEFSIWIKEATNYYLKI